MDSVLLGLVYWLRANDGNLHRAYFAWPYNSPIDFVHQYCCAADHLFWFSIVGGSGLAFELANPGLISSAFEGFNLPAVLLAITGELPFPMIISVLFLILTTTFIVTTGDSMTYTISVVMTGSAEPNAVIRSFGD